MTSFVTDFEFGTERKVNVGIFDEVRNGKNIPMGSASFEIGEILGARGNTKAKRLKNGGTLFVRIAKAPERDYGNFHLALKGVKLKNVEGLFGKSDPFFVIKSQARTSGGRSWAPVYRSEVAKNDLNPMWKDFSIPVGTLCAGDVNRPIQIEVYDWQKSGKHRQMGKFQTNLDGLVSAQSIATMANSIDDPSAGALILKHKGESYGKIIVTKAVVTDGNAITTNQSMPHTAPSPKASGLPNSSAGLGNPPSTSQQALPPPVPIALQSPELSSFQEEHDRLAEQISSIQYVVGKGSGKCPSANMRIKSFPQKACPGYSSGGTIEILYDIPSGTQSSIHPHPGVPFDGDRRRAFLPSTPEGRCLLSRFRHAFSRGEMFRIGRSLSSGKDHQVIWSDIPNKTSLRGGPYGFPDSKYIEQANRVLDKLGIPPADGCLPSSTSTSDSAASFLPPPLPPPMAPPKTFASSKPSTSWSADSMPQFVDYISGGTEINLVIAIDFSSRNGNPKKPGTLHYLHSDGQLNDYEKAITSVGSIVARYDSDKKISVYGFGAKYKGVVQHCFQIGKSSHLDGVSGVLEGYRSAIESGLDFSSPTVFAEVIQYAATEAVSRQEMNRATGKQSYSILLLLTTGAVTDIEQTKTAIKYSSSTPLSIVIVGVGNFDFAEMKLLDDLKDFESGVQKDIVKFVDFSRYRHSRQDLTRETLDEIPDQLVDYFYSNGILPLPPERGSQLSIYAEEYNEEEDAGLGVNIGPNGEIVLDDSAKTTWDANSYGNVETFLPSPMAPPSQKAVQAADGHYLSSAPTAPSAASTPLVQPAYNPYSSSMYTAPPTVSQTSAQTAYNPYASSAPTTSSTHSQPAYNPYTASFSTPSSSYTSQPFNTVGGGTASNSTYTPYVNQSSNGSYSKPQGQSYVNGPPISGSSTGGRNLVRVKAPEGSYKQVRVKNPNTGQYSIVDVPPGVTSGQFFNVYLQE